MHTRVLSNRKLRKFLTVRLLDDGDTATVAALFGRLGDSSPERRFGELVSLARVDADHHVLVAYVDDDPLPAGIVRLVRGSGDRRTGEIALVIADDYQDYGIENQLVELLLADVRPAGILYVDALLRTSNRAALSLLRRALAAPLGRVTGAETTASAAA